MPKRKTTSTRRSSRLIRCWLPAIAAAATATTTTAATTTATTAAATAAATIAAAAVTTAATLVTAAATVATATTTAAVATAPTAAEPTATATTTTTARLALLGLVHAKRATVEGMAIHALDRLLRFLGGTHGHEREATAATGLAIGDEVHVGDGAEILERGADAFSIGVERKIANIQTSVHRLLDPARDSGNLPALEGGLVLLSGFETGISPLSTGERWFSTARVPDDPWRQTGYRDLHGNTITKIPLDAKRADPLTIVVDVDTRNSPARPLS